MDVNDGLVVCGLHLALPPAAGYPRKHFEMEIVLIDSPQADNEHEREHEHETESENEDDMLCASREPI